MVEEIKTMDERKEKLLKLGEKQGFITSPNHEPKARNIRREH